MVLPEVHYQIQVKRSLYQDHVKVQLKESIQIQDKHILILQQFVKHEQFEEEKYQDHFHQQ